MKDEVFNDLVQKICNQVFADMEKDGEVGKLISKLLSGVVVASVSYAVEQTIKFMEEDEELTAGLVGDSVDPTPESEPE